MKQRTILVWGLAAALAGGMNLALADSHGGDGMKGTPEQKMKRMRKQLGLTEEQATQMREIYSSDASGEEKRAQLNEILTDEQRQTMAGRRSGGEGSRGMTDTSAEGRMKNMRKQLDLSEEQATQMREIYSSDMSAEDKKASINEILTPEQRQKVSGRRSGARDGGGDKVSMTDASAENRIKKMRKQLDLSEEQATQMREIFSSDMSSEEKQAQLNGVLTDEQREKLKQGRGQRR